MKPGDRFKPNFQHADIVDRQSRLPARAKILYRRLVRYAGTKGFCWPAIETISHEMGRCARSIHRDLAVLHNAKLLEHTRGGPGKSNRYFFIWHEIFSPPDATTLSHQETSNVASRCDKNGSLIGHSLSADTTTLSHESVSKLSGNRHAKPSAREGRDGGGNRAPIVGTGAAAAAASLAPAHDTNPRAAEAIIANLAIPNRHLRTVRRLFAGVPLDELPKLPDHVSQRVAPAASRFLGRLIEPADLTQ